MHNSCTPDFALVHCRGHHAPLQTPQVKHNAACFGATCLKVFSHELQWLAFTKLTKVTTKDAAQLKSVC
jgi:hypothetical protein